MKYGRYAWEKLSDKVSKNPTLFLGKAINSADTLKTIEKYETKRSAFSDNSTCKWYDKFSWTQLKTEQNYETKWITNKETMTKQKYSKIVLSS